MSARLHHGTMTPDLLRQPLPPARESHWWSRSPWRTYDRWIAGLEVGDAAMPYANHVWLSLGFQERGRPQVPEALKRIRSFNQLGSAISILFVTDDERHALRYGSPVEIDADACGAIALIHDPNVRTANAWIMVVPKGATILRRDHEGRSLGEINRV